MLNFFNFNNKLFWFISTTLFSGLIFAALFFQIVLGMQPCYLCIIQRIGVIISLFFSILGLLNCFISSREIINKTLKYMSLLGTIGGLGLSIYSAIKLVYMQMNPPLFSSCGASANDLINNYGFLNALPILFKGSASCSNSAGEFLFLTFEQWTLTGFIFISFFILLSLLLKIIKKV